MDGLPVADFMASAAGFRFTQRETVWSVTISLQHVWKLCVNKDFDTYFSLSYTKTKNLSEFSKRAKKKLVLKQSPKITKSTLYCTCTPKPTPELFNNSVFTFQSKQRKLNARYIRFDTECWMQVYNDMSNVMKLYSDKFTDKTCIFQQQQAFSQTKRFLVDNWIKVELMSPAQRKETKTWAVKTSF